MECNGNQESVENKNCISLPDSVFKQVSFRMTTIGCILEKQYEKMISFAPLRHSCESSHHLRRQVSRPKTIPIPLLYMEEYYSCADSNQK